MAEEETSSRITELKARLEADPESRVFYQLGEELRKAKRPEEAEAVLRQGLGKHPGYLSALISLGRVLKETSRSEEAIETLNQAFELDRQNVVVARLLGEVYSDTGDHVEAIKKYKLVAALHPADEEIQDRIQQLEQTLKTEGRFEDSPAAPSSPPPAPPSPPPASETFEGQFEPEETVDQPEPPVDEETDESPDGAFGSPAPEPFPAEEQEAEAGEAMVARETGGEPGGGEGTDSSPDESSDSEQVWSEETRSFADAQDDGRLPPSEPEPGVPESPDSAGVDSTESARDGESPDWGAEDAAPEEPLAEARDTGSSGDVVATITMADLYARQGHVEQARAIYRQILDREPGHQEAQDGLESLPLEESGDDAGAPAGDDSRRAKVQRLEDWLSKVRG